MIRSVLVILVFGAGFLLGCDSPDLPDDVPRCVKRMVANEPQPKEVWRYQYQNQVVYLIVPDCCDQYTVVYSSDCDRICAPGGGFTGNGDGLCENFFQQATSGVLLWKSE